MSVVLEKKRKVRSPYLDQKAKVALIPLSKNWKGFSRVDGGDVCGAFAKVGQCSNGHRYLKILYCNKEWCENCRQIAHNRRIARWLPKALTMKSFGYFVFTIPLEMREFYREKKNLSQLRTYLRKRLRQIYPDIRALARWHWFGENPYVFHPHLNVMVDAFERLPEEELERIKQDYKNALVRFTGIRIDKKVDVYYHYYSPEGLKKEYEKKHKKITDEEAQELYKKIRWHRLRYITRPTFTHYNRDLAEKLKNYRNCSVWGKNWGELPYEEVEKLAKEREAFSKVSQDVVMLENGDCPICGGKIHWQDRIKRCNEFLIGYKCRELGQGYFLIGEKRIRGSPRLPSRKELEELRHYRWLLKNQNWLSDWLEKEQKRKDIYD